MPDLGHIVPIVDDAVLDGVGQLEDALLGCFQVHGPARRKVLRPWGTIQDVVGIPVAQGLDFVVLEHDGL